MPARFKPAAYVMLGLGVLMVLAAVFVSLRGLTWPVLVAGVVLLVGGAVMAALPTRRDSAS